MSIDSTYAILGTYVYWPSVSRSWWPLSPGQG
jgi:hypothetical protein